VLHRDNRSHAAARSIVAALSSKDRASSEDAPRSESPAWARPPRHDRFDLGRRRTARHRNGDNALVAV
jgi:hypothetical protein